MSMMEEISDRGIGLPLGIGLAIAAVSAGPKLVKAGRPLIKGAIKGYLTLAEKSKEMFAETSERLQDLYAEAKYEYDHEVPEGEAAEPMKAQAHHEEAGQPESEVSEGSKPSRARRTKKQSESEEQ